MFFMTGSKQAWGELQKKLDLDIHEEYMWENVQISSNQLHAVVFRLH